MGKKAQQVAQIVLHVLQLPVSEEALGTRARRN